MAVLQVFQAKLLSYMDESEPEWLMSTWSFPLDCLWPPTLLWSAWTRLFPLWDRWESAFSTTSMTGSFWPSQKWSFIAQNPPPQPPRASGAQGQLRQKHAVSQPTNIVRGNSSQLDSNESHSHEERALAMRELATSFEIGATRPLKTFQRMLGLMAAASPALQFCLLRLWPLHRWLKPQVSSHAYLYIRVSQACVTALAPWKDPHCMEKGMHGNGLQEKGCQDRCCAKANQLLAIGWKRRKDCTLTAWKC